VISAQVAQQRPRRPHPRGPLVDPWPLDASVPPLTPALVLRFPVGPLPAAEWRIGRWLGERPGRLRALPFDSLPLGSPQGESSWREKDQFADEVTLQATDVFCLKRIELHSATINLSK
jgi:hypothetical protein